MSRVPYYMRGPCYLKPAVVKQPEALPAPLGLRRIAARGRACGMAAGATAERSSAASLRLKGACLLQRASCDAGGEASGTRLKPRRYARVVAVADSRLQAAAASRPAPASTSKQYRYTTAL